MPTARSRSSSSRSPPRSGRKIADAVEAVRKQLVEAEKAETASETKRLRRAAEQSKRNAPDLYARYEKAADEVFAALDAIDELQDAVDTYN